MKIKFWVPTMTAVDSPPISAAAAATIGQSRRLIVYSTKSRSAAHLKGCRQNCLCVSVAGSNTASAHAAPAAAPNRIHTAALATGVSVTISDIHKNANASMIALKAINKAACVLRETMTGHSSNGVGYVGAATKRQTRPWWMAERSKVLRCGRGNKRVVCEFAVGV